MNSTPPPPPESKRRCAGLPRRVGMMHSSVFFYIKGPTPLHNARALRWHAA